MNKKYSYRSLIYMLRFYELQKMQSLTANLYWGHWIELLSIKDVEKIEAALDIAVITSKAEALCLSIIESMIAGIPAIGTDSGGVAEVIQHGENGFLVSVGDSDGLAERIEELLADDVKRRAFGANGKKRAESMFLADKMTRRIEKLYLEAGK